MSISVTCPQCGTIHNVNDALAGRRVRCPQCDTAVHVPELDPQDPVEVELVEVRRGGDAAAEVQATPVEINPWDENEGIQAVPVADPGAIAVGGIPVQAVPVGDAGAVPPPVPTDSPAPSPATASSVPPPTPVAAKATAAVPQSTDSQPQQLSLSDLDDDDDDALPPRSQRDEEELDMTPMVDVTFLLLIFFMVTASFSLQKSIMMPRQQTDAPSTTVVEEEEEDLESVEVQVDEFGSFLVISADDWEREAPGKQNLISTLKEAIEGHGGMRLVIKIQEQCKLQFLVDAMDAGTIAGYAETQVTQVEDFD